MNKEIKFKVWDKERKEFLQPYNQGPWDKNLITVWTSLFTIIQLSELNYIIDNKCFYSNGSIDLTRFELCQFTGCVDKNKKEIYEGDIIQVEEEYCSERGEFEDYTEEYQFQVIFENGLFGRNNFGRITPLKTEFNHWTIKKYNVIGNVFENPELIK
jgi:uncharacterized phage protein (TIGR01671 family)